MEERFNIIFQNIGGQKNLSLINTLKQNFQKLGGAYKNATWGLQFHRDTLERAAERMELYGQTTNYVTNIQGRQVKITKEQTQEFLRLSDAGMEMRKTLLYLGFGFWIAGATLRAFAQNFFNFLKTSTQSLADFDWAMTRVGILLGTTAAQTRTLRNETKKWAATTIYTLTDIANAEELLALSGFRMNQILAAMPGIIQLASLEGMDLKDATDIAAATMHAYNLEAEDMITITNSMAITSAESAIEVSDLGESLKYAGAQAGLLNISVVETNAVLGVAGQQMIRGGRAGRYLAFGLQRLAQSGYDVENGLLPVLKELENQTKGMTATEQLNFLTKLLGARAARLYAAVLQKGTAEVERFVKMQDQAIVKQALQNEEGRKAKKTFIELVNTIKDTNTLQIELQKRFDLSNSEIEAFVRLWSMGGSVLEDTARSWNKILTASGISEKQMRTVKATLEILNDSLEVLKISLIEPLAPLIKIFARVLSFLANIFARLPAPLRFTVGLGIALFGIFGLLIGKTLYFAGAIALLASSFVQLQMTGITLADAMEGVGASFAFAKSQIFGATVATKLFTRASLGWLGIAFLVLNVLWLIAEKMGWIAKLTDWLGKLGDTALGASSAIDKLTYGSSPGGLVDLIKYSKEASKVSPGLATTETTIPTPPAQVNVNIYNPTVTDIETLDSFQRIVTEATREAVKEVEWRLD